MQLKSSLTQIICLHFSDRTRRNADCGLNAQQQCHYQNVVSLNVYGEERPLPSLLWQEGREEGFEIQGEGQV